MSTKLIRTCARCLSVLLLVFWGCPDQPANQGLIISENGYFEMPGLNVLVFNNSYSEGHQGGVEIIQHNNRVATGGNLRFSGTRLAATCAYVGRRFSKSGVQPPTNRPDEPKGRYHEQQRFP